MKTKILGVFLLVCFAPFANATMPNISVSYSAPSGRATTADAIEMWVHIESDRQLNSSFGSPFGFDAADLPKTAQVYDWDTNQSSTVAFSSYTSMSVIHGYGCSPTCDVSGYSFQLQGTGDPTRPGFLFSNSTLLQTGDFLVGTYLPNPGLSSGTYIFPIVPWLQFNVSGLSASGKQLNTSLGLQYEACPGSLPCSFKRTVVSVPESSTFAYLLIGLVGIFGKNYRAKVFN